MCGRVEIVLNSLY